MAKLIVKPTVNFLYSDTDSDLATDVDAINSALTDNEDYLEPSPTLELVAASLRAFNEACAAASFGGTLLKRIKNSKRTDLVFLMRELARYVATACQGDLTVLLGSGFPIHKPTRHAIGALLKPRMPTLSQGKRSGEMFAKTKSVRGVFIYNWQLALLADPTIVVMTAQSTGATNLFSGLIPGQVYIVQVNAVGAAGNTDWSGSAQLMVV
jgi:hypothetical protein